MAEHKFVFICGLHRSGTSILHEILREQPGMSGFQNTGVPEDEGQHLQSVFPAARVFGGPGVFGFHEDAAMTETHPLLTDENRKKLFQEWSKHWDLSAPTLIEKSPPNIIRTRFLQAVFPGSYFIIVMRHPLAVALATRKWSKTSVSRLIEHWLWVHHIFERDRPFLVNCCLVSYEQLVHSPPESLNQIGEFIGAQIRTEKKLSDHNPDYFKKVEAPSLLTRMKRRALEAKFEKAVREFGYSIADTSLYPVF